MSLFKKKPVTSVTSEETTKSVSQQQQHQNNSSSSSSSSLASPASLSSPGNGDVPSCARFEAQTWRRNMCKNCYRPKDKHISNEKQTAASCDGGGASDSVSISTSGQSINSGDQVATSTRHHNHEADRAPLDNHPPNASNNTACSSALLPSITDAGSRLGNANVGQQSNSNSRSNNAFTPTTDAGKATRTRGDAGLQPSSLPVPRTVAAPGTAHKELTELAKDAATSPAALADIQKQQQQQQLKLAGSLNSSPADGCKGEQPQQQLGKSSQTKARVLLPSAASPTKANDAIHQQQLGKLKQQLQGNGKREEVTEPEAEVEVYDNIHTDLSCGACEHSAGPDLPQQQPTSSGQHNLIANSTNLGLRSPATNISSGSGSSKNCAVTSSNELTTTSAASASKASSLRAEQSSKVRQGGAGDVKANSSSSNPLEQNVVEHPSRTTSELSSLIIESKVPRSQRHDIENKTKAADSGAAKPASPVSAAGAAPVHKDITAIKHIESNVESLLQQVVSNCESASSASTGSGKTSTKETSAAVEPSKQQLQLDDEEDTVVSRVISEARKLLEEEDRKAKQDFFAQFRPNNDNRLSSSNNKTAAGSGGGGPAAASVPARSKDDSDVLDKNARTSRRRTKQDEVEWRKYERSRSTNLSRDEAMMEGTRMLLDNLKEKVTQLEDKCGRLDKDKATLNELLASRRREYEYLEDEMKMKICDLEDQIRRLANDKNRLMDRMNLPESERGLLQQQEKDIADLYQKLEEVSIRYADAEDENIVLKQEIKDLQLGIDEMHDQFREEEALEFRELQKELEIASKNCRIYQFKLRKAERRAEQAEADRMHFEERLRSGGGSADGAVWVEGSVEARQRVRELEEELRATRESLGHAQDEMDVVEERRARYEEELDRVNDLLTESERCRIVLQKENDRLSSELQKTREQLRQFQSKSGSTAESAMKMAGSGVGGSVGLDFDLEQLMRDLTDSLERENDLKEQLRYTEEEAAIVRKKLADIEEENENLNAQLQKATTRQAAGGGGGPGRGALGGQKGGTEGGKGEQPELRLQLDLAEHECSVLRRKVTELERGRETLQSEVKLLKQRVEEFARTEGRSRSEGRGTDARAHEDQVRNMAREIDKLKTRLIETDAREQRLTQRRSDWKKKSRSLDEGDLVASHQQVELMEDEVAVLRIRVEKLESENERLLGDNRRLQLLSTRPRTSNEDAPPRDNSKTDDTSDVRQLKERIWELEIEVGELVRSARRRDAENEKLAETLEQQQRDAVKAVESWRSREKELGDEIDNLQQKNNVLSSLADVVTERAEAAQREVDRLSKELSARPSDTRRLMGGDVTDSSGDADRSSDVVLGISSIKSLSGGDSNKERELRAKVTSLERQLADEREKVAIGERHAITLRDRQQMDAKSIRLMEKERDIVKQELALSQKQLRQAEERVQEIKDRLGAWQQQQDAHRDENTRLYNLLQEERAKAEALERRMKDYEVAEKEDEGGERRGLGGSGGAAGKTLLQIKEPASWRWEKQEMEKQMRELKRKLDEQLLEVRKLQNRQRPIGENGDKEYKRKDYDVKDADDFQEKLREMQDTLNKREVFAQGERDRLEKEKIAAQKEARNKDEALLEKDNIIAQKNELVRQKDVAIRESDKALKNKENELKAREKELQDLGREIREAKSKLKEVEERLKLVEAALQERESKIKSLNDDVRRRDDRLKEKDDILEKINRRLVEKETEVSDMDNSVRQAIKKLQQKEEDNQKLAKLLGTATSQIKELQRYVHAYKAKLQERDQTSKKDVQKLLAERDNADKLLKDVEKEMKNLTNELQEAKESLKAKEEEWASEKSECDFEIQQLREKLRSIDSANAARGTGGASGFSALRQEKEQLAKDKQTLSDELARLKWDMDEKTKKWNTQKEQLEAALADASRNKNLTAAVDKSTDFLKQKQQEAASNAAYEKTVAALTDELEAERRKARRHLEQGEQMRAEERNRLEEVWERKRRLIEEQLAESERQAASLAKESKAQMALLQSSRSALADIKTKYDAGLASWREEKEFMQCRVRDLESKLDRISATEKELDELRVRVQAEETKRQDLEVVLSKLKSATAAAPPSTTATTPSTVKSKADEPMPGPTKMSVFKAKFEKFGEKKSSAGADGEGKALLSWMETKRQDVTGADRTIETLQKNLKAVQQARDIETREAIERFDKKRTEWDTEKKELKNRIIQLERRLEELSGVEQALVDVKQRLYEEEQRWQEQRNELSKRLEAVQISRLIEKDRAINLLAEAKRLQPLAATLQIAAETAVSSSKSRAGSRNTVTKSELIDEPTLLYMNETIQCVLKEISHYEHPDTVVDASKTLGPLSFKRSLSSSEAETKLGSRDTGSSSLLSFDTHLAAVHRRSPNRGSSQTGLSSLGVSPLRTHAEYSTLPSRGRKGSSSIDGDRYAPMEHERRPSYDSDRRLSASYASGTQSAVGSREGSPETRTSISSSVSRFRSGTAGRTAYPLLPPSMIITPTHSRESSVERVIDLSYLTAADIDMLYRRLHSAEGPTEVAVVARRDHSAGSSAASRRGAGAVLRKSISMDASPNFQPLAADATESDSAFYVTSSSAVDDLPLENFQRGVGIRTTFGGSTSSARRRFFDDYDVRGGMAKASSADLLRTDSQDSGLVGDSARRPGGGGGESSDDEVGRSSLEKSGKKQSKFSALIQRVKDRRGIFGSKKTASIDTAIDLSPTLSLAPSLTADDSRAPLVVSEDQLPSADTEEFQRGRSRDTARSSKRMTKRSLSADVTALLRANSRPTSPEPKSRQPVKVEQPVQQQQSPKQESVVVEQPPKAEEKKVKEKSNKTDQSTTDKKPKKKESKKDEKEKKPEKVPTSSASATSAAITTTASSTTIATTTSAGSSSSLAKVDQSKNTPGTKLATNATATASSTTSSATTTTTATTVAPPTTTTPSKSMAGGLVARLVQSASARSSGAESNTKTMPSQAGRVGLPPAHQQQQASEASATYSDIKSSLRSTKQPKTGGSANVRWRDELDQPESATLPRQGKAGKDENKTDNSTGGEKRKGSFQRLNETAV